MLNSNESSNQCQNPQNHQSTEMRPNQPLNQNPPIELTIQRSDDPTDQIKSTDQMNDQMINERSNDQIKSKSMLKSILKSRIKLTNAQMNQMLKLN